MNTLLNALTPILNTPNAKVSMDITPAATPGELQVIVRPFVGPVSDKATEELRQLKAALAQPIKVVGTPEDIEAALAQAVEEQAPKRNTWANRAAELDAAIAAAAASDIKKKKTKSAPAGGTAKTGAKAEEPKPETVSTEESDLDKPEDADAAGFSL